MERTGAKINAPVWQPTPAPKQTPGDTRSPQLPEGSKDERQGAASRDQDHYSEPKAGAIFDNVAAAIATAPPAVALAPQSVPVLQNIQPKLTIGAPGDRYEQEADRVAEQVVQRLQASGSARVPGEGEGGDKRVQRKPQLTVTALSPQSQGAAPNPDGSRPRLQCQRQTDASEATPEFETALNRASGGQPLASQFRLQAENLMGSDFRGVKIHTDGAADQLNQSIQAKAFTTRQDIFFRQGEYNPSSSEGQTLLAHELTHVIQQNSGTVRRKEEGAAIDLSSVSQSMIQADKDHLQVPSSQNEPAQKDAMPPGPRSNAQLEDASQNDGLQNLEEANLSDDAANDEALSNEIDSEEDVAVNAQSGLDADEIITIKTIKENLKSAGKSYGSTEIAAMAIEKLYYSFEEDKSYVDQISEEMTAEDIEVAEQENEVQLQNVNEQLNTQADEPQANNEQANDKSKSEIEAEEKKKLVEEQHRLKQAKAYLGQMKSEKQAKNEVFQAQYWTKKAQKFMVENYQRRSQVGLIYQEVQDLRERFAAPSKKAEENYKKAKEAARAESSYKSSEAAKICELAKADAAELKQRKIELIKLNRVAPDFSEAKMKWAAVKGPSAAKTKIVDLGRGLISGGYLSAKVERDKRGFQKSINKTNVREEAQKAYQEIQRERKTLDAIKLNTGLAVFPLADSVVSILQACDRGVWTGLKRIIRFVKLYMSALSAIPVVGPVFAAITSVLSVMSGVISGLQALSNMIIATVRGLQIWKEDARLTNVLGMSMADASLRGFSASLKEVLFGLDQGGQMELLSNENVNVSSGNETVDDEMESELNESAIAETGVMVAKPVSKEITKNNYKAFKLYSKVKQGDLVANLPDNSIAKQATVNLFKKAMTSVIQKTGGFQAQVEPFSSEVAQSGVDLNAANQEAANKAKNDEESQVEAQEPLQGIEESGGAMQSMGAALKEIVEVVGD